MVLDCDSLCSRLEHLHPLYIRGKVAEVIGLTLQVTGLKLPVGEVCRVLLPGGKGVVSTEVVGFRDGRTLLMSLGDLEGISPGCEVIPTGSDFKVPIYNGLLGKVLDGLGRPMDGTKIFARDFKKVDAKAPNPLQRPRISQSLTTGIKSIDTLLTSGKGQRMGIFAGSGVGKSTILGMMAKHSEADVNVLALIGERGREVKDFLERDLGPEGLKKSVVIAVTSDQPSLVRIKGAFLATAVAEYFRDQGLDVLLAMDSVTRFALAQREVGLAIGEPPATKGYTPSVFTLMPKLLERAGNTEVGSITGFYTVLVEGDDMNEPIADAVRGILDGHIVLSREIAARNIYPAVDVLQSVSRVMPDVTEEEHLELAGKIREVLARYHEIEDLINIGAYKKGNNPEADRAVELYPAVVKFLKQGKEEYFSLKQSIELVRQMLRD